MTRFLAAAATAFALALAAPPALAADCHGDCANCPHRAGAAAAKDAPKDCGCAKDGKCTCKAGCKCEHCAQRGAAEGKQAPGKAAARP
ncbi:MAG TPA: hypothetical protein VLT47_01165 [Anaeromyxobacteraceae bacterium]|nr:hypothetical protein [Anaeromyxobacteraceae bacterium]